MPGPSCTDQEFIRILTSSNTIQEAAQKIGVGERALRRRKKRLEAKYGPLSTKASPKLITPPEALQRRYRHATGIIFSDSHPWPGIFPPAYLILLRLIPIIKPDFIIANGDVLDGYSISRHSRIGWDEGPTVAEELEAAQIQLGEIAEAGQCETIRTIGNHDIRFDTFLASHAAQMEGVPGMRLDDHFPDWPSGWSVTINDQIMVKHRWKGGKHAAYNNAVGAGVSIVTGHTHHLNVRPHSDYTGTRYGVECGTLTDPRGPQFLYCEHSPLDWQPGFAIVHIDEDGHHFETVDCSDGTAWFHGKRFHP